MVEIDSTVEKHDVVEGPPALDDDAIRRLHAAAFLAECNAKFNTGVWNTVNTDLPPSGVCAPPRFSGRERPGHHGLR